MTNNITHGKYFHNHYERYIKLSVLQLQRYLQSYGSYSVRFTPTLGYRILDKGNKAITDYYDTKREALQAGLNRLYIDCSIMVDIERGRI